MYALFEDAGKFFAGRVMSEADTSTQIELDSGKRVKAKNAQVLLKFEKPSPSELLADAQRTAAEIDLDLAWEFAPDTEFAFTDLASGAWGRRHADLETVPAIDLGYRLVVADAGGGA